MTSQDVKFPYYSGNIKLTKAIGHLSLEQFVDVHKSPSATTKQVLACVAEASRLKDMKLKRSLKHKLYSFTPSVIININDGRKYENIQEFTGLMQLDFDGIENRPEAEHLKLMLYTNHPEIVCIYLSPSGLGIKALLKITKCKDVRQYKAIHKAMVAEFEIYSYLDESTKNAMLPLFLSADTEILYRDYAACATFTKEDWSEPKYVNLVDNPIASPNPTSNALGYLKTVKLFEDKIRIVVDNGHPQLRNSCLTLGSRIAAGYIDRSEGVSLMTREINNNAYFHKDVLGYLKTGAWGIEQGMKNPKYY